MSELAARLARIFRFLLPAPTPPGPCISVEELHHRVLAGERLFLLDVRTPEEFAANRLSFTSALIPHDLLSKALNSLPPDKLTPIFTFCRSGHRSEFAAAYLRSKGYPNTYNVNGGIIAWMQAGFETVRE